MSPSDLLTLLGSIAVTAASIFIMVKAFSLGRVLIDRPYKSRALWTGIGASALIFFLVAAYVTDIFGQNPTTVLGVVAEAAIWGCVFIVLYGWIASNVIVAIAADFLNRDALLWKAGLRVVVPVVFFTGYVLANIPPWWLPESYSTLGFDVVTAIFVAAIAYMAAVLVVTYRRISDRRIKKYTMWVALSILSLLVLIVLPSLLVIVAGVAWIHCMYRSVESLAIKTRNLAAA